MSEHAQPLYPAPCDERPMTPVLWAIFAAVCFVLSGFAFGWAAHALQHSLTEAPSFTTTTTDNLDHSTVVVIQGNQQP